VVEVTLYQSLITSPKDNNLNLHHESVPAFIDRDPTGAELERFRLLMSLHRYGIGPGGVLKSGELYPFWTFIEMAFAEAFGGVHVPAGKGTYDVLLPHDTNPKIMYGIQVKSKGTWCGKNKSRAYVEFDNANKTYLDGLHRDKVRPAPPVWMNPTSPGSLTQSQKIGNSIMKTQHRTHSSARTGHLGLTSGQTIDTNLGKLVHITWSHNSQGLYQYFISCWDYNIKVPYWRFKGAHPKARGGGSLWGYVNSTDHDDEHVASWNFASRGQFKWFPLRSSGKEYSNGGKPFVVEAGPAGGYTWADIAKNLFPTKWK
jgi:hypothetical protein